MADFTIKRGDTWRPLEAILHGPDNAPIDLTDADNVRLILRSPTVLITTGAVDIVPPRTSGRLSYQWGEQDTAYIGLYNAEFEIEWNTGDVQTVPNDGYFTVAVVADLDQVTA